MRTALTGRTHGCTDQPLRREAHFAGYADETGTGPGEGANLNLPLPFGADDAAFIAANTKLCDTARAHGAEALILSAGWDAHCDDPISKLAVSTDAYARIGELYGRCWAKHPFAEARQEHGDHYDSRRLARHRHVALPQVCS